MKKRNVRIILAALVVLVLLVGIHSIFGNYRFGQELYEAACRVYFRVQFLIDSIDDLEKEFAESDNGQVCYVYHHQYDSAIGAFQTFFGYEDMPVLDEVKSEYSSRIGEVYRKTMKNEEVENIFTNEEEFQKMAAFRDQMKILADGLKSFIQNYRQTSALERYFTSWKKERRLLSDQVRIPE